VRCDVAGKEGKGKRGKAKKSVKCNLEYCVGYRVRVKLKVLVSTAYSILDSGITFLRL